MDNIGRKEIIQAKADSETGRRYAYWLSGIPSIGSKTIQKLIEACGSAEEVYRTSDKVLATLLNTRQLKSLQVQKSQWDVWKEYDRLQEKHIRLLLRGDREYPGQLREIPDAPYALFLKGSLPDIKRPAVAVIGARECSEYGRFVAEELGKALGENGVQVISGMARGIDGITQAAALKAGGSSFGVLGCGVDICYPKQNRELYNTLLERGGIFSTYIPGTLPKPQNFPPRNRIVSGLADAVVVIEARKKSGTLITVDMALEQGREVYAVPGRVTDRLSDGCNCLIRQGAGVVISPDTFLEEMWENFSAQCNIPRCSQTEKANRIEEVTTPSQRRNERGEALTPELRFVLGVLDFYPQSIEEIRNKLSIPCNATQLNMMLVQLCMKNLAIQLSPGYFCIKQ